MRSKTSTTSIIGVILTTGCMVLIFSIVHMSPVRGNDTIKNLGLTIASSVLTGVMGFYFGNSKKEVDGDSDK